MSPKVDFAEDKSDKMPSRIQGIRVIVDAVKAGGEYRDVVRALRALKTPASRLQILLFRADSVESSSGMGETVKIKTQGTGGKQTVGVHTDITFDVSDKNDTKPSDGRKAEEEDDDEEVPVFKGTESAGGRADTNRRYNPKSFRPNLYGINDEADNFGNGDTGTWVKFLPSYNGWTTEPNYKQNCKRTTQQQFALLTDLLLHSKRIEISCRTASIRRRCVRVCARRSRCGETSISLGDRLNQRRDKHRMSTTSSNTHSPRTFRRLSAIYYKLFIDAVESPHFVELKLRNRDFFSRRKEIYENRL